MVEGFTSMLGIAFMMESGLLVEKKEKEHYVHMEIIMKDNGIQLKWDLDNMYGKMEIFLKEVL